MYKKKLVVYIAYIAHIEQLRIAIFLRSWSVL